MIPAVMHNPPISIITQDEGSGAVAPDADVKDRPVTDEMFSVAV
jgi:hypothetical protein